MFARIVAQFWTRFPPQARLSHMRATAITVFLFVLSASVLAVSQQEKPTWREYTYPADGFAVTAPTEPKPHDSPALPGATAYMVQLGADTGVVLRAKTTPDCSAVVPRLKEGLLGGKDSTVDISSLKDLILDRHPGLEYKRKAISNTILERCYCTDGRLYVLTATWPSSQSFPPAEARILDSFRLLAPNKQP